MKYENLEAANKAVVEKIIGGQPFLLDVVKETSVSVAAILTIDTTTLIAKDLILFIVLVLLNIIKVLVFIILILLLRF